MLSTLLIMTYSNNSRQLKKIITELLFKWIVNSIHKINYSKSYKIDKWKLIINEEKIIIIETSNQNINKTIEKLNEKWLKYVWTLNSTINEINL